MTRPANDLGLLTAPLALSVLLASGPSCADESLIDDHRHLGPATCASSVCHGKLARQEGGNVWLNEYRIWTRDDKHSLAYRKLESDESRRMATNLGLGSATTADVCLDCHADNVSAELRGPRFQLTDGVSCEACHGGAELWIESHAADGATHAANLVAGMYPTESPVERARICLSCHMGSSTKFAGHDIYGAGHPRLSFELEVYTALQPAHYEVDDDYRERKGDIPRFNLWLAGQMEAARRFLSLLEQRFAAPGSIYPELAFYDCHGCHHEMDDRRWTPARGGDGVAPGSLRVQDQHLLIVQAVASVIESAAASETLQNATQALIRSGQRDSASLRRVASELIEWFDGRQRQWASREFDRATVIAVRKAVIQSAASGRTSDFAAAEQVFMAMESLSYALGDRDQREDALDRLFAEVEDHKTFSPSRFAITARNVQGQF